MKSKSMFIMIKMKCKLVNDYFSEVDVQKHLHTFKTLLQEDEVLGFTIGAKLGEPLKEVNNE